MLYRMEAVNDNAFVVRDADTDHEVLLAVRDFFERPHRPHGEIVSVWNKEGHSGWLDRDFVGNPVGSVTTVAGNYETRYPWRWERRTRHGILRGRRNWKGWVLTRDGRYLKDSNTERPAVFRTRVDLQRAATAHAAETREGWEPKPDSFYWERRLEDVEPGRIERRLGVLLADAASAMAVAVLQYGYGGGLQPDTKQRVGDLIVLLNRIWYASRFGAYDAQDRVTRRYFAGPPGAGARMSFGAAAPHYGMAELRTRFPDISEAVLGEALSLPLDVLRGALNAIRDEDGRPPYPATDAEMEGLQAILMSA